MEVLSSCHASYQLQVDWPQGQLRLCSWRSRTAAIKALKSSTEVTSRPQLKQVTNTEPAPVMKFARAFAPATVANLGPGYDFLGCAIQGLGDFVTAEVDEGVRPGEIRIKSITGDKGRLGYDPESNCAGIACKSTMQLLGIKSLGISLSLEKGLPLGSGLGSSAASAAAACVAVNALFGSPLSKMQLVVAGLESEATVSGYHADNVAPSLMGGFVLVRSYQPSLELIPLAFPRDKKLLFVLSTPNFEAPTKEMRRAVPRFVEMTKYTANSSQVAALVSAILKGDVVLLGSALSSDCIVEVVRGPLIPGMLKVKKLAIEAGAFGCTISGAGPTAVAITDDEVKSEIIGQSMVRGFGEVGDGFSVHSLDFEGARLV